VLAKILVDQVTIIGQPYVLQVRTLLFGEELPWDDVAVVLHLG
jgi:hypothetical protein